MELNVYHFDPIRVVWNVVKNRNENSIGIQIQIYIG